MHAIFFKNVRHSNANAEQQNHNRKESEAGAGDETDEHLPQNNNGCQSDSRSKKWSGLLDANQRPHAPQSRGLSKSNYLILHRDAATSKIKGFYICSHLLPLTSRRFLFFPATILPQC